MGLNTRLASCGLFSLLILASQATAGWMGFRNDTSRTLIVQESMPDRGGTGRVAASQKIYANETIRDNAKRPAGQRTFTIYDAERPDRPLYNGQFSIPAENENVLVIIKSDGKGGITVETARNPPHETKR